MLDLVAGFGGPDGLTREGIAEHVALERAAGRATAMRRLMAMDLNADGDVQRGNCRSRSGQPVRVRAADGAAVCSS
jgi:hypothetical protein